MYKYILFLVMLFAFSVHASESKIKKETIKIGVAHFPPYVDKNRRDLGMFPNYLKKFFDQERIGVKFVVLPFSKTRDHIIHGTELDFSIFSSPDIIKISNQKPLLATEPFFRVQICLFHSKRHMKKGIDYKNLNSLKKYNVVVFDKAPTTIALDHHKIKYKTVDKVISGFRLLHDGEADVYIQSMRIGGHYLQIHNLNRLIKCENYITDDGIHIATSDIEKHKALVKRINKFFKEKPLK